MKVYVAMWGKYDDGMGKSILCIEDSEDKAREALAKFHHYCDFKAIEEWKVGARDMSRFIHVWRRNCGCCNR